MVINHEALLWGEVSFLIAAQLCAYSFLLL